MKALWAFLLCSAPAIAAITGTVLNHSTGKPETGVTVGFYSMANGPQLMQEAKTDAKGAFSINQEIQGFAMLRVMVGGVSYDATIRAGDLTIGITMDVYNSSTQPGVSKVSKHMILFQPSGGQMSVKETYLLDNKGDTTWNDPINGTLHFYLPAAAADKAKISATPPRGIPIFASTVKTDRPDVYAVDFAMKPGETRVDLDYSVAYTEGAPYTGKVVSHDDNTYLIAPNGVTLTGDHLNDLGAEAQTQAHIYGLEGTAYKVSLTGTPIAAPAVSSDADSSESGPQFEVVDPHLFGQAPLILGLALGVLALGFAILYRAEPKAQAQGSSPAAGKETNARGRG